MLHEPGPDAMAAAERAVEYARMVDAHDIELNARLTLGGLMADAGDIEAGLAEMYEVKERATELGVDTVLARAFVNLPSVLEGVGRSEEAVRLLEEGVQVTRRLGLLDSQGWVWGNLAESLLSVGRWEDAARAAPARSGSSRAPSRAPAARCAWPISPTCGATPQERPAASPRPAPTSAPTTRCPSTPCRCSGSPSASPPPRAARRRPAPNCPPRSTPASRPAPSATPGPLLLAATTAEADRYGDPATEPGRADVLDRIRRAARNLATGVPLWQAHDQWLRAELRRAEGRSDPDAWSEAVAALEPLGRPHDLACVRLRLAEALLAAGGGEDQRARATELLRLVDAVACHLGAAPLARDAALLARRGRLALTPAPRAETAPAPADPAEALGLTSRERDVLRLVAAGHTNRRIAEELFISPKTASVHVSNILAKLGVSGRGEAAAVAHRLGLFPDGLPDGLPEGPGHLATARQSV